MSQTLWFRWHIQIYNLKCHIIISKVPILVLWPRYISRPFCKRGGCDTSLPCLYKIFQNPWGGAQVFSSLAAQVVLESTLSLREAWSAFLRFCVSHIGIVTEWGTGMTSLCGIPIALQFLTFLNTASVQGSYLIFHACVPLNEYQKDMDSFKWCMKWVGRSVHWPPNSMCQLRLADSFPSCIRPLLAIPRILVRKPTVSFSSFFKNNSVMSIRKMKPLKVLDTFRKAPEHVQLSRPGLYF